MEQTMTQKPSKLKIGLNRIFTYLSKPHNLVLLILGIVLSISTIAPIISIVLDYFFGASRFGGFHKHRTYIRLHAL